MFNKKIIAFVVTMLVVPVSWGSLMNFPTNTGATGLIEYIEPGFPSGTFFQFDSIGIGSDELFVTDGVAESPGFLQTDSLLDALAFNIELGEPDFVIPDPDFNDFEGAVAYSFTVTLFNNLIQGTRFLLDFVFEQAASATILNFDNLDAFSSVSSDFVLEGSNGVTYVASSVFVDPLDESITEEDIVPQTTRSLDLFLAAGEILELTGTIDIEAGLEGDARFSYDAFGSLQITDVQVVSEPSALALMLFGVAGLVARRKVL